jgi:arylsulfatase A-like enzyme
VTSNGPLRAGKGTLYEGGVRVCACAAWEGRIRPGTVIDQPLHIVDWYPTLLNLAGVSLEQKLPLDGRDAWPTLAAGRPSPHAEILLNAEASRGAIRVGDWKLVLNGTRRLTAAEEEGETPAAEPGPARPGQAAAASLELFNLANDLSERTNLASARPEKVKELRARYDRLAEQAVPPKNRPKRPEFKSPAVWGEPEL